MADVKIIDIDNIQWNMKDQKARDDIAALQTNVDQKVNTVGCEGVRSFVNYTSSAIVEGVFTDSQKTGLIIDFDFGNGEISITKVVNDEKIGTKKVKLS